MTNVRNYTDIELIERVEKLPSFKGWKKGITDVWVRSNEDAYNKFDDKVYTFECLNDGERPKFIMVCSGTTNAGVQGLKNFEKYGRASGCAVAVADYICYDSHVYGLHGKSQYPAYIQRLDKGEQYPYTRDNDKDEKSENYGKIYTDRIGMNCHRASQSIDLEEIGLYSVACLVRNKVSQWKKWLAFMNKRKLTVCILNEF